MRKKNATDLLRFYGGDIREKTEDGIMIVSGDVMADELWGDKEAYRTLNAMLFDGYENEKERIYQEGHRLNPAFIERIEETLEIYRGIFSLMCRRNQIEEPVRVKRVDRKASLYAYETGYTGSFVSCTKGNYQDEFSNKNQVILLEADIQPGIPCADFQQLLTASEYTNSDEKEILLPPFLPLEIKQVSLEKKETKMLCDMNGNLPVGKYFLKLGKFPDYRQEIRESEEELKERIQKGSIKAASELRKMNDGQWEEEYRGYIRWKQNLHAYLKLVYSDIYYGEKTDG